MARNTEEEQAAAAELCAALLRIHRQLAMEDRLTRAHARQLRELVSITLWKHSEASGKFKGCRYWSTGALGAAKEQLTHEHVHPRSETIDLLLALEDPSHDKVRRTLDELNIGAVVTKGEHVLLKGIKGCRPNVWERYQIAGVQCVDVWKQVDA